VNNHQPDILIKHVGVSKFTIVFDRLSLCFNDPNPENVESTYGLLVSEHITKSIPGLTVTKNPRYMASCRLRLPFDGTAQETICFEAGARRPGQASYRIDFNPSKLSEAGLVDLMVFLESTIDPYPLEFFRGGKVTRCDVALDLPGYHLEDVIVRTARLQKHGVYADRYGQVETTYLGTPRSRCVVAYDKPQEGGVDARLRLECRLKPRCLGYELAQLDNPFAGVQLLPADFSEASGIGIPSQLIADSIRIGGLKRVLLALDPEQRKLLRKAHKDAVSLLPNLDAAWAGWPSILASYGLGKELGAVPVMAPGTSFAIDCKPMMPSAKGANVALQSTASINLPGGGVQPCPD
jgi:hypothetical protein